MKFLLTRLLLENFLGIASDISHGALSDFRLEISSVISSGISLRIPSGIAFEILSEISEAMFPGFFQEFLHRVPPGTLPKTHTQKIFQGYLLGFCQEFI